MSDREDDMHPKPVPNFDLSVSKEPQSDAHRVAPQGTPVPLHLSADRLTHFTICTRPFRPTGPRLEEEQIGGKRVIHNYGHGGAGWSLTWGCADDVLALVGAAEGPVAVIGAGAIGLVTALRLAGAGHGVTIYADKIPQETGSAYATGSWSPDSRVALATDAPDGFADNWDRWAKRSYAVHQQMATLSEGAVEYLPRYTLSDEADLPNRDGTRRYARLKSRLEDLMPPVTAMDPAAQGFTANFGRKEMRMTFNIAQYTSEIETAFEAQGGKMERRIFHDLSDIASLDERVVVNCTGFGAKALFGDDSLIPVRGQIGWLAPQPDALYGIDYRGASALSRRDGIVIQDRGDTDDFGVGIHDETPNRAEFEAVLKTLERVTPQGR